MNARTAELHVVEDSVPPSGAEPRNGSAETVRGLRDQALGRGYAMNIAAMEYAQTSMAGMLDFAAALAQLMSPMGMFGLQDNSRRAK